VISCGPFAQEPSKICSDIKPSHICILEERLLVGSNVPAETTRVLLNILEDVFHRLNGSAVAIDKEAS